MPQAMYSTKHLGDIRVRSSEDSKLIFVELLFQHHNLNGLDTSLKSIE